MCSFDLFQQTEHVCTEYIWHKLQLIYFWLVDILDHFHDNGRQTLHNFKKNKKISLFGLSNIQKAFNIKFKANKTNILLYAVSGFSGSGMTALEMNGCISQSPAQWNKECPAVSVLVCGLSAVSGCADYQQCLSWCVDYQ